MSNIAQNVPVKRISTDLAGILYEISSDLCSGGSFPVGVGSPLASLALVILLGSIAAWTAER